MPRQHLEALVADVNRLLAAGAMVAAGDEGLRRRTQALRELGHTAPVLGQVAEAAERVCNTLPERAAPALLDLLLIVRQIEAGFAHAGPAGPRKPLPRAGPWQTNTLTEDVIDLTSILKRSGMNCLEALQPAVERGLTTDLRLLEPALRALTDPNAPVADLVAERLLPQFGRAAVPSLRRGLDIRSAKECCDSRGRSPHGRRLAAICRIDSYLGAELCRKALRQGSRAVRPHALESLPLVAPRREVEQTALAILGAGNADGFIPHAAIDALIAIGAKSKRVLAALVAALTQNECTLAWRASRALGRLGKAAVPTLIEVLTGPGPFGPADAARALKQIGPDATAAIPALTEATQTSSEELAVAAMEALGAIGPEARSAGPLLHESLYKRSDLIDVAAGKALVQVGHKVDVGLSMLTRQLKDRSGLVRRRAADALAEVAPQMQDRVARIMAGALMNEDVQVRLCAAQVLGRIDPEDAVGPLTAALRQDQPAVRREAALALARLGGAARGAADALAEAANDPDPTVRRAAVGALAAVADS